MIHGPDRTGPGTTTPVQTTTFAIMPPGKRHISRSTAAAVWSRVLEHLLGMLPLRCFMEAST
jgi:hypothetical protein